ncbi:MAG TPA: hypothetical protein VFR56_05275 [Actinomycetes bacterium]|nr:hypothetical protein [Actinomycetes bacterium]
MTYLLDDQASETQRLRLQSQVWEPAGRRLLDLLGDGTGSRVLDVGCGAMGCTTCSTAGCPPGASTWSMPGSSSRRWVAQPSS